MKGYTIIEIRKITIQRGLYSRGVDSQVYWISNCFMEKGRGGTTMLAHGATAVRSKV